MATCVCVHTCVRAVGLQVSVCIYEELCLWAQVCVSMCMFVHTRVCVHAYVSCVHIQVKAVRSTCILKIMHLCLSTSRDIFPWLHLCSHMCLRVSVYVEEYQVCACVCVNLSVYICTWSLYTCRERTYLTARFWMGAHMCQGQEGA